MAKARASKLKFTGEFFSRTNRDGEVVIEGYNRFHEDMPARDLDENDIARLSDEQYERAIGGKKPVYVDPSAKSDSSAKASSTKKTAPAKKTSTAKGTGRKTAAKTSPKNAVEPAPANTMGTTSAPSNVETVVNSGVSGAVSGPSGANPGA